MQARELIVRNPSGLHARPAALFVETASRFGARITVENLDRGSRMVDAKSILLLLAAGGQRGHRSRIAAPAPGPPPRGPRGWRRCGPWGSWWGGAGASRPRAEGPLRRGRPPGEPRT